MIWNGVRLFQGRRILPAATFIGAILWLGIGQIPGVLEKWQRTDRRRPDCPGLHVFHRVRALARAARDAILARGRRCRAVPARGYLSCAAGHACSPADHNAAWLTVFTLETIIYAVDTAFIVMLMVKDHHVHFTVLPRAPII
jgi:hypothetical protein